MSVASPGAQHRSVGRPLRLRFQGRKPEFESVSPRVGLAERRRDCEVDLAPAGASFRHWPQTNRHGPPKVGGIRAEHLTGCAYLLLDPCSHSTRSAPSSDSR